jgi:putative methionine-R-sulfoxide reductase with GAF domain
MQTGPEAKLEEQYAPSLRLSPEALEALYQLARAMNSGLDTADMLTLILERGLRLTAAQTGYVLLRDKESGKLETAISVGHLPTDMALRAGTGIEGLVVQTGLPISIPDVERDSAHEATIPGERAKLAVPILQDEEVIGVIGVSSTTSDVFGADDLLTLEALAIQAGIAMRVTVGRTARELVHPLNTALGIVAPSIQMIELKCPQELRNTYLKSKLDIIRESTEQGLDMISRLGNPLAERPCQVIDICETIDLVVEKLVPDHVRLERQFEEGLPPIPATRELSIALHHVIQNAVEAIEQDDTLSIACKVIDEAWLHISFQDTGSGIDRDTLKRVFDPFFSTKKGRLGLGLWRTRRFAEKQRGKIQIESNPNAGTKVTILLPIPPEN